MDILNFHKKLIHNYKTYIQSFLNIKDPLILNFVDTEIENNKLWPEPLVQFNPTFEKGRPLFDLVIDSNGASARNQKYKSLERLRKQLADINEVRNIV